MCCLLEDIRDETQARRMDEILERLLRQHPEAVPIRRSKYIPDCHVGRGRVWRAGQPVVTGSLVYPEAVLRMRIRDVYPGSASKKFSILTQKIVTKLSEI